MAESELDGAGESIDEFVTQLHYARCERWDRSWERVCSKGRAAEDQEIKCVGQGRTKKTSGPTSKHTNS